jgi:hypothetical protein
MGKINAWGTAPRNERKIPLEGGINGNTTKRTLDEVQEEK